MTSTAGRVITVGAPCFKVRASAPLTWLALNEPHAHKDLGLAYQRAGRDDVIGLPALRARTANESSTAFSLYGAANRGNRLHP